MPRLSPAAPSSVEKNDGEGVEEKKPVAPFRIGDAKNAHAHAAAKVLGIALAFTIDQMTKMDKSFLAGFSRPGITRCQPRSRRRVAT